MIFRSEHIAQEIHGGGEVLGHVISGEYSQNRNAGLILQLIGLGRVTGKEDDRIGIESDQLLLINLGVGPAGTDHRQRVQNVVVHIGAGCTHKLHLLILGHSGDPVERTGIDHHAGGGQSGAGHRFQLVGDLHLTAENVGHGTGIGL